MQRSGNVGRDAVGEIKMEEVLFGLQKQESRPTSCLNTGGFHAWLQTQLVRWCFIQKREKVLEFLSPRESDQLLGFDKILWLLTR